MNEDSKFSVHNSLNDTFNSSEKLCQSVRTNDYEITSVRFGVGCSVQQRVSQTETPCSKDSTNNAKILSDRHVAAEFNDESPYKTSNKSSNVFSKDEKSLEKLKTSERFKDESIVVKKNDTNEEIPKRNLQRGRCKWFNTSKGWGFITTENNSEDIFVHQSAIHMNGFRDLIVGQEVDFECKLTSRGLEAVSVTMIDKDCERKKSKSKKIRCFNCGEFTTHLANECDQSPQPKKCHHCKSEDHLIGDCPLRIAYLLLDEELKGEMKDGNDSRDSELSDESKSPNLNSLLGLNNSNSENEKKQLNHEITSNKEIKSKEEISSDVAPSINQISKQGSRTVPIIEILLEDKLKNSEKNSFVIGKKNFLNKSAKLINYKKLTKKIKKPSSTSSLSTASSSSELSSNTSSNTSSKSASPCSFSYPVHYTQQANHGTSDYNVDDNFRHQNYLMVGQSMNGQLAEHMMSNQMNGHMIYNPIITSDQFENNQQNSIANQIYSNHLEESNLAYYDQLVDSYLPLNSSAYHFNYNENYDYRPNQSVYTIDRTLDCQARLPFKDNLVPPSHFTSQPIESMPKFCSLPYSCNDSMINRDIQQMNFSNSNNYHLHSSQYLPVHSQTSALHRKLADSYRWINYHQSDCANCTNQVIFEEKLRMNHSCLRDQNRLINYSNNCHNHNCSMNACTNHCRIGSDVCKLRSCMNCVNHHCDTTHYLENNLPCQDIQFVGCKSNCCQCLKTNLIPNTHFSCHSSSHLFNHHIPNPTADVPTSKKVLEQFETDSGIATRCSTANGSLEIE